MENESVGQVVTGSLNNLYDQVISFLPVLVVALLVLIFGWAVAILLGRLVRKILDILRVDELASKLGMGSLGDRMGKKLSVSGFGDWLIKWFFIVTVFVAAADLLGLNQVGEFLYQSVLPYFADVVVAAAIMVIGVVAANFLHDVVLHSVKATKVGGHDGIAEIARWAVLIFTFLAVLSQLGVATTFLQDLFRAVVAMLAIAGGIAFGLGGREHAKHALDRWSKDLHE